ncbi:hypothetical protein [Streptomyces coelicoflavus]
MSRRDTSGHLADLARFMSSHGDTGESGDCVDAVTWTMFPAGAPA